MSCLSLRAVTVSERDLFEEGIVDDAEVPRSLLLPLRRNERPWPARLCLH